MAETSETAYKAHDVLWIAFDPVFGQRAVLNEVYTERPDDWALRYRLDATQEPGVVVTSDRDASIASAARREERARLRQVREDIIRQVAQLVRLRPAPVEYNETELVKREHVVTIAMRLRALADKLIESEAT